MKKATKQRERQIMKYEKTHQRYRAQNLNYFKRYILNIKIPIFLIFYMDIYSERLEFSFGKRM